MLVMISGDVKQQFLLLAVVAFQDPQFAPRPPQFGKNTYRLLKTSKMHPSFIVGDNPIYSLTDISGAYPRVPPFPCLFYKLYGWSGKPM